MNIVMICVISRIYTFDVIVLQLHRNVAQLAVLQRLFQEGAFIEKAKNGQAKQRLRVVEARTRLHLL